MVFCKAKFFKNNALKWNGTSGPPQNKLHQIYKKASIIGQNIIHRPNLIEISSSMKGKLLEKFLKNDVKINVKTQCFIAITVNCLHILLTLRNAAIFLKKKTVLTETTICLFSNI